MGTLTQEPVAPTVTTEVDLSTTSVRELNAALHAEPEGSTATYRVLRPRVGTRRVGLDRPVTVTVEGHVGYYAAGMNQHATVEVHGNAGSGWPRT